eukprot:scaffold874_cov233-Pinguiococcus_pyrenoidosus.AAC.6
MISSNAGEVTPTLKVSLPDPTMESNCLMLGENTTFASSGRRAFGKPEISTLQRRAHPHLFYSRVPSAPEIDAEVRCCGVVLLGSAFEKATRTSSFGALRSSSSIAPFSRHFQFNFEAAKAPSHMREMPPKASTWLLLLLCLGFSQHGAPFVLPRRVAGTVSVRTGELEARFPVVSAHGGAEPPRRPLSVGTDATQTMKRIIGGVLEANTAEEAAAVLGEHVTFLLDARTPERFRKASGFFIHVDKEELDEVFGTIVDFLEAFVDSTSSVEKRYQLMARELLEAAKEGDRAFDRTVNGYGAALNYEFLQYLDGQMDSLSKMDPERRDLMGEDAPNIALLRMLRVRVSAMLDETFGPYFAELTRLLAIDDDAVRRRAFLNSSWIRGVDDEDDDGGKAGTGLRREGLTKLLSYIKREMEDDPSSDSRRAVDRQVLYTRINELLEMVQHERQGPAGPEQPS